MVSSKARRLQEWNLTIALLPRLHSSRAIRPLCMKQTFGALVQSLQLQCSELFCHHISPAHSEYEKRNIIRGDHMEETITIRPWKELLNPWERENMGKPIASPVVSVFDHFYFCCRCAPLPFLEQCLSSKCFEPHRREISLQSSLQCTQAHYRPIFVVE